MALELLPPALLLSTVLALIWATAWFVWQGGDRRSWLVNVLAALLGFGLGQAVGWAAGLSWPAVGEVRVIEGTLLAWLMLWAVQRWRGRS